ncbi:MAG TPA: CdaR family protein [Vicinamibacteria bacterium]|nr:CdaR family protein [Vicinamibacteria bacterium]
MRSLFDNLALKGVSLLLAALTWFVIAGEKTSERGLSVPVELQNFPKDLELTGEAVTSVEVRLRASPGIIHGLGPRDISALIDLQGVAAGERIVHLSPDTIRVPFGVKVVKVTPSILTLNFEHTLEKDVPVRPRLQGRPAPGYEVAEVTSEPARVRITGPRSRVQEIESAFTEPVSLEAARETVMDTVNIGLEDPVLRLSGGTRVKVTARIREEHVRKALTGLALEVRGGSAQARPATVRVEVSGPVSVLKDLDPVRVRPYVTITRDGLERAVVAVELYSGLAGVSVVETSPPEVLLKGARKAN